MNKSVRYLLAILVAGLALTLALVGFSQPVQAEIPTEDLNNNILTSGLTTSGLYPTPQWWAEGNQEQAYLGHSVATAGDVNGDGYEDVIVGSYGYDVGDTTVLTNAGRAYVYYGSLTGLSATPDWMVEGDQVGGSLGVSAGTAGDVNGDGYDDVIVGAYAYDVITGATVLTDAGRVYIYYGSAAGLSTTPAWTAGGDQEGGLFGSSVATAGDVNGDNYDDVIIGAYKYDHGHTDEGRVYVYHGSSSGPGATAAWTAESDQDNTYFGLRVGTAGDVNGDGYDEVIVAAPVYDNGTFDEGAIFVWYGSNTGLGADGTPTNAGWLAESNHWGFQFGRGASTAGDVNGDGYDDVIAGCLLYNIGGPNGKGAAFGWYGSAAGLGPNGDFTNADWTVVGEAQENNHFGQTVANAGDVNGDGYDDALVGAYAYDNGETDEGRAYLFLGSGSGLNTTAAWTVEGDQVSAVLGYSLATAGDVNGDGYDDAIIGAHGYDNGETDEGRAYVYHGDPPPEIVGQEPAPGATDVPVNANVVITFSETITTGTFAYTVDPDPGGWSAAWSADNTVVTLSHANFAGETTYTVTVSAAHDMTGNPLVNAPVAWGFTTVAVPITGLSAVNDSPTVLGDATTLTATITAGSNVAYTWAFGDGDTGNGAVVNHTYPAVAVYTATVTATNSVGVVVATTTVTVEYRIYLPLVLRNFP